ncbi:MAG TPA: type II toxin-antitoxin system RelE/ParE family toxin [Saprospiraceae bacterium]|nr:type II toxin-antitoxin system RelE/ParE family toxin [Saprospiraceae bacterium]
MIKSFADKETERIWEGKRSKKFPTHVQARAREKLVLLDAAEIIDDLKNTPGNRMEKLKGKPDGFCSIHINDRYRVIFE